MTRAVFSSVRFAPVRGSASSARALCSWAFQSTKAVTRIGLAIIVGVVALRIAVVRHRAKQLACQSALAIRAELPAR